MQSIPTTIEEIGQEYAGIEKFVGSHPSFSYEQFDRFVLKDVTLFDVPKDEYFRSIENQLDEILKALPSLKRIFAKPLIRLKDTHEIVPVEQAHVVDSHTFSHASFHSELWEDITKDGIKPRKLMAVGRTETFVVYENLVLTHVVDDIFRMLRRARTLLLDVLYDCCDMQFNFLDRTHHDAFFLAIGKLHMEYARAQIQPFSAYARCVDKIRFIEKTLRPGLNSPLYLQCKKNKKKITLKKSNAFRLHKDYKDVYRLAVMLDTDKELMQIGIEDIAEKSEGYRIFCVLISIFAAGHFHFSFDKDALIDPRALDATCTFCGWSLNMRLVRCGENEGLMFSFKKEREYRVCLMLGESGKMSYEETERFRGENPADEYLFADSNDYGEREVVYLSLFNIDSFRRIQQILLRGMIYSDMANTDCPFCGHEVNRTDSGYECPICRGEVKKTVCPDTQKEYFLSCIKGRRSGRDTVWTEQKSFLHDRYVEARMHFRNITPLAADGSLLCPHCGKQHDE